MAHRNKNKTYLVKNKYISVISLLYRDSAHPEPLKRDCLKNGSPASDLQISFAAPALSLFAVLPRWCRLERRGGEGSG